MYVPEIPALSMNQLMLSWAPSLGHKRLTTLRVGNSVIEERVADAKVACGTQVATGGTARAAVISERGVRTHEGSASKRQSTRQ